jgi:hypothetical protein
VARAANPGADRAANPVVAAAHLAAANSGGPRRELGVLSPACRSSARSWPAPG